MARPCVDNHSLSPESCRLCFWCMDTSDKGKKYRELWNEPSPYEIIQGEISRDSRPRSPTVKCPSCPGNTKIKVHEELSYEMARKLFIGKTPPQGMPGGWGDWDAVKKVHLDLLNESVEKSKELVYPKDKFSGKGIVMPAGGHCTVYGGRQPYFWCAYVASYVLRKVGCDLPLQFWFLGGELENWMLPLAKRVGAECVDARALGVEQGMRCPWGWQLKIHAIINSPFQEVLHLDSDNIVAKDPLGIFDHPGYKEHGAVFWADLDNGWGGKLTKDVCERIDMPWLEGNNDIESGQLLIDKERCWSALHVVKHLADHADYWGGQNGGARHVWYGDKTDFHVGFRKSNKEFFFQSGFDWDHSGFFRHKDHNGDAIFQHACRVKGHLVKGEHIPNLIGNDLIKEAHRVKNEITQVPWLDGSALESRKLMFPGDFFDLDKEELGTWINVVSKNEYRLPDRFSKDDIIIDIGANVGAFSYACLRRGAKEVTCIEPVSTTMERCRKNLYDVRWRVNFIEKAVWVSGKPSGEEIAIFQSKSRPHDSGSNTIVLDKGKLVQNTFTISLDELIDWQQPTRLIKLDCEGSEYPILYTSTRLHLVEEIVGEYHNTKNEAWNGQGLKEFLVKQGFVVDLVSKTNDLGNFYARRR